MIPVTVHMVPVPVHMIPVPVHMVPVPAVLTEASEVVPRSFLCDAIHGWVEVSNTIAQAGTSIVNALVIAFYVVVYALVDILEPARSASRCQQDSNRDNNQRDDLHVKIFDLMSKVTKLDL